MRACLTVDPTNRPKADQVLNHQWLKEAPQHVDLLPNVKAAFDGKKTCMCLLLHCMTRLRSDSYAVRKAVFGMMAVNRMKEINAFAVDHPDAKEKEKFAQEVEARKQVAEDVSQPRLSRDRPLLTTKLRNMSTYICEVALGDPNVPSTVHVYVHSSSANQ